MAERLALLAMIDPPKDGFAATKSEPAQQLIVTTRARLDQPALTRGAVSAATLKIKRSAPLTMEQLLEKLNTAGYERVAQVTTRGQIAVRGGIVDLYSWQAPLPTRIEFFGDNVESLREFDIDTQTSVSDLRKIDVLLGGEDDQTGVVRDYIGIEDLTIEIEPNEESAAYVTNTISWSR